MTVNSTCRLHTFHITAKSCHISAITRAWPSVPRLFALTKQLSALVPVVGAVAVVRSVLLERDMQA